MSFVAILTDPSKVDNPFFHWQPEVQLEVVPEDMIGRLSLKIEEKLLEPETEYESIILHLGLSYEHFLKGNCDKSLEILSNMNEEVLKTEKNELNGGEVIFWLPAVQHLLRSSMVHVLVQMKRLNDAEKHFKQIPLIQSLDRKNQAALWGFRASLFAEYGIFGSKAGVQYATTANEMDPEEALWYFVKGKLLGRVRRVEKPFDIPLQGELEALEMAVNKEANAAFTIFTAQVYRETANRAYKKHRYDGRIFAQLKEIIDDMNDKSLQLYRKSLLLKPYCAHINFRCAKGFMSLPPPFKDTQAAKKCLLDGLKMSPTSAYGNHAMAGYCERCEKDINSAINYLKLCVPLRVFGAEVDLLRLEYSYRELSKADVISRLNKMYLDYVEPSRRCQTLSQFVSFYLFVEYDLEKAIDYLIEAFRLNSTADDIQNHRSIFLKIWYTVSLLDIVVDEVKIRLGDKNGDKNTRCFCNKFLTDLAQLNIAYPCNPPRYLRQTILQRSGGQPKIGPKIGRPVFSATRRALPNTTMTYLQRRSQRAAADETLRKIDDFTNSWKESVSSRTAPADHRLPTRSSETEANAADPEVERKNEENVLQAAKIRYKCERQLPQQRHQSRLQPQQQQRTQLGRSDERGRLRPATDENFDQVDRSLASLTISEGDKRDSDFELSVQAYRRAKQGSGGAVVSASSAQRPTVGKARSTAVSSNLSSSKTKTGQRSKTGDNLDNYLARSMVELEKKFEPDEIFF